MSMIWGQNTRIGFTFITAQELQWTANPELGGV
jgi:hypothetical protein